MNIDFIRNLFFTSIILGFLNLLINNGNSEGFLLGFLIIPLIFIAAVIPFLIIYNIVHIIRKIFKKG